jgi:hypothetical protein
MQAAKRLYHRLAALKRSNPKVEALFGISTILLVLFAITGLPLLVMVLGEELPAQYALYKFNHLSSAEHFRLAEQICHIKQPGDVCYTGDPREAVMHLEKISSAAPEYRVAVTLLGTIRQQENQEAERKQQTAEKEYADRIHKASQSEQDSRAQWLRNIQGLAHDSYQCGTSWEKTPIVSFDSHYWYADDGRCASVVQKQQQEEESKLQNERKRADEVAQLHSYWPTTLRVDTDMDSFWLDNEERTCQTYPNSKGRVSVVACNASGSHRDHNIPVEFWGGVDRNTVSDWKCRRESNSFVCRAVN